MWCISTNLFPYSVPMSLCPSLGNTLSMLSITTYSGLVITSKKPWGLNKSFRTKALGQTYRLAKLTEVLFDHKTHWHFESSIRQKILGKIILFTSFSQLSVPDDLDSDFFENIRHVQLHRRGRALTRLAKQIQVYATCLGLARVLCSIACNGVHHATPKRNRWGPRFVAWKGVS